MYMHVRLSSTQPASVGRNLAWFFLLHERSLFTSGNGEREMREVRKNKANALLGSLGFTPFYVRGHQAGHSVLFLIDTEFGTEYYSSLTVTASVCQEHLWQDVEKAGGLTWKHSSVQVV